MISSNGKNALEHMGCTLLRTQHRHGRSLQPQPWAQPAQHRRHQHKLGQQSAGHVHSAWPDPARALPSSSQPREHGATYRIGRRMGQETRHSLTGKCKPGEMQRERKHLTHHLRERKRKKEKKKDEERKMATTATPAAAASTAASSAAASTADQATKETVLLSAKVRFGLRWRAQQSPKPQPPMHLSTASRTRPGWPSCVVVCSPRSHMLRHRRAPLKNRRHTLPRRASLLLLVPC